MPILTGVNNFPIMGSYTPDSNMTNPIGSNIIAVGAWNNLGSTGAVCVHNILLPNDSILCIERPHVPPFPPNPNTGGALATEISLKDIKNNKITYQVVPINSNPFCGGHSQRSDGSIGMFGGDKSLWKFVDGSSIDVDGHTGRRLYLPCTDQNCTAGSWFQDTPMTTGRWYPTVATLYDGSQIIIGGIVGNIDMNKPEGNNPTYEYYPSKEGAWPKQLDLLSWCFPYCLYPTVMQLPSGNVMIMASNKTILLNPADESISFTVPDLIAPDHMPWVYPHTPSFVLLPLTVKNNYRATLMMCGGSAMSTPEASTQCWQINPDEASPVWKRVDDMPHGRVMPDTILLPDGKILYVNGAGTGMAGGLAGECRYASNPVYAADLFDPEAPSGKQWTTLESAKNQRIYHSEANLIQTGHVITTGSEMLNIVDYSDPFKSPNCYPKNQNVVCTDPFNYQMESFSPPYLQKAERLGRLVINDCPAVMEYGKEFDIKYSGGSVYKVYMIRYSATTHSTNTDQRLVEVPIIRKRSGVVTVRSFWSSAIGPPGNWMVWLLNKDMIPSESKTLKMKLSFGGNYNLKLTDPYSSSGAFSTKSRGLMLVVLCVLRLI